MPGLKDIAKNLRRKMTVGGVEISIRGISGDEMAGLLGDFPELGKMLTGAFGRLDAAALISQAPDCVAQIIALGTSANGHAPEEADIADARALPGLAALELLAGVAELTLPRSVVRPFVQMVLADDGEESAAITRVQDTK